MKPIGGQIGDGDGIGVAVFFGFFFFTGFLLGFLLGFLVGFLVVEAVGLLVDVFDAEGAVDALLLGFGVGVAALVGAVRKIQLKIKEPSSSATTGSSSLSIE
mgnify:CR=1 FL=1